MKTRDPKSLTMHSLNKYPFEAIFEGNIARTESGVSHSQFHATTNTATAVTRTDPR